MMPAALMTTSSCTDLTETLYDQVASKNYYNTKDDVIRAVLRPFEHGFWSIQSRQVLNEETADQLITPTREDWWMMVDAGLTFISTSGTTKLVRRSQSSMAVIRALGRLIR